MFEDVSQKAVTLPVLPSRGNFVEGGVTAALWRAARLDITGYRRTFSQFADDDVLLNTGIGFPIAFDSARVNGMDVKVTMPTRKGISGYLSYSLMKGSATLPAVGGLFLGEEALQQLDGSEDIAITQDQRHTIRGRCATTSTRASGRPRRSTMEADCPSRSKTVPTRTRWLPSMARKFSGASIWKADAFARISRWISVQE